MIGYSARWSRHPKTMAPVILERWHDEEGRLWGRWRYADDVPVWAATIPTQTRQTLRSQGQARPSAIRVRRLT